MISAEASGTIGRGRAAVRFARTYFGWRQKHAWSCEPRLRSICVVVGIWASVFYNESMPAPILTTKLYIPPPRPKVVLRPRLMQRLNEGLQRASGVTLISAPAGFG